MCIKCVYYYVIAKTTKFSILLDVNETYTKQFFLTYTRLQVSTTNILINTLTL